MYLLLFYFAGKRQLWQNAAILSAWVCEIEIENN